MSASFWDATSQLQQDYIIIGGGIIGLTTAITLKKNEPNAKVLVLEHGVLPQGASTRNAGFTCFGSLTEILEDMQVMGTAKAIAQVQDRWEGLQLLRTALGDSAIDFKQTGNYELVSADLLPQLKQLPEINKLLRPIFGGNVFSRVDANIEKFGFAKQFVHALILNQFEGQLDSGKMMSALEQKAQSLGIIIRYGSKAERPRTIVDGLEVPVKNPQGKPLMFRARAVAVCINGYMNDLLPEYSIQPGRGQILVTEPLIKPLKFSAPCHMGKGFWYFRALEDNRILLGGGRNLFLSQETTTKLETTANIMGPLKAILQQIIVPGQVPRIDYSWAGLMGFSKDHIPRVETVPGQPHLVIGFGCNGMGVARGYHTGQKTAALLKAQKAPADSKASPHSK
jgi:glycine/D-amino acid oxidase-like deaminating enzyme